MLDVTIYRYRSPLKFLYAANYPTVYVFNVVTLRNQDSTRALSTPRAHLWGHETDEAA